MHHFQVDENMCKAQKRSAALTEKFWFRKNIAASTSKTANVDVNSSNEDATYTTMSINEIINGKVKLYYSLSYIDTEILNLGFVHFAYSCG